MPLREDPVGDLLVIIELTELAARVPVHALGLWTLDCAGRALGADIREIEAHRGALRSSLARTRGLLREDELEITDADVDAIAQPVRDRIEVLRFGEDSKGNRRAIAAAEATLFAILGALGRAEDRSTHESVARRAQDAFEDRDEEALAQARRLLLRARLIPSGAELLVRLDFAEANGALPPGAEERAWIDSHRALLMAEDQDSRFAVTLRYLEIVFLGELDRAP